MRLCDILTLEHIQPEMRAQTKRDALDELAALMAGSDELLRAQVRRVLAERERLASTAIGDEVAIPHGKLEAVKSLCMGLGRSSGGLEFESVDGQPTRLFFVLLAAENETGLHLKALARISRLCKEPELRSRLLQAAGAEEMYQVLCSEDAKFQGP
jgi:nitrogen PTS system EIIA component